MIEKRKIEMKKGQEILARLDEIPDPILSARQFIVMNFDTLQKSGKTLKALHHFLLSNGLDVGNYEYFQAVYNSEKRARKANSVTAKQAAEPEKANSIKTGKAEDADAEKTQKEPWELRLRPIRLSDGREILIDPETGGKHFKI